MTTTAPKTSPKRAPKAAPKLTEAEQLAADEAALAERRRKIAAEAVVIDVEGEVVDEAPGAEVAVADEWPHQTFEYANETWEVRKPTQQALAGFMLSTGKYVPGVVQQNMVGLFITNHLSEASLERVYVRLLDPVDPDFTEDSLGEIMAKIASLPDADAETAEADA